MTERVKVTETFLKKKSEICRIFFPKKKTEEIFQVWADLWQLLKNYKTIETKTKMM